jgi:hypothetical protein
MWKERFKPFYLLLFSHLFIAIVKSIISQNCIGSPTDSTNTKIELLKIIWVNFSRHLCVCVTSHLS